MERVVFCHSVSSRSVFFAIEETSVYFSSSSTRAPPHSQKLARGLLGWFEGSVGVAQQAPGSRDRRRSQAARLHSGVTADAGAPQAEGLLTTVLGAIE